MQKRLFVVHGRSTKPSRREKARLVDLALRHGLTRVDERLLGELDSRVRVSLIYYGDISNQLLIEHDPERWRPQLEGRDADFDDGPCEPDGSYDADLRIMFKHEDFSRQAYQDFLHKTPDTRGLDDLARIASSLVSLTGLSDRLVARVTPDMGAYLSTRKVGSQIRERLQAPLAQALIAGDDICIVSHSMGCIVTYDVLWKLAQMSEYAHVRKPRNSITHWITIGCPLGEPGVRSQLYDSNERSDGRYPVGLIKRWTNISARDDFVAHDASVADDFREFDKRDAVAIEDLGLIHNFWRGYDGHNPHKLYGYLDNPTFAAALAGWLKT